MVAGLALVAVSAVVWLSGSGAAAPAAVGPGPAAAAVSPSPALTAAGLPSAVVTPAPTVPTPVVPVPAVPTPGAGAGTAPDLPARITLAGLDVDVPVVSVGVDDRGQMEVPVDVQTVGWYRFGPGPGSDAGSSVLSGHVDDRVQGRGAFYRLSDLGEGDPVQITLGGGAVLDYRVRSVERIDKSDLPVQQLFARDGAPRLTLVTCGGEFDQETRNYRDNVVVTAEPVGAGGNTG